MFPLDSGFPATFLNPADINYKFLHIRATNPQDPRPYVQQWSIGFQRELMPQLFPGSRLRGQQGHAPADAERFESVCEQRPAGVCSTPSISRYCRIPNFGLLEYSQNDGNSSYNGLDLTLERRFTAGLSMRLAYTWSKSIDNTAEELSVYGSNAFSQITNNQNAWRGPSDFDVPQRIVFSWVYELPFGKGKPWASSGIDLENRRRLPDRRVATPTPPAGRSPRSRAPTTARSILARSRRFRT